MFESLVWPFDIHHCPTCTCFVFPHSTCPLSLLATLHATPRTALSLFTHGSSCISPCLPLPVHPVHLSSLSSITCHTWSCVSPRLPPFLPFTPLLTLLYHLPHMVLCLPTSPPVCLSSLCSITCHTWSCVSPRLPCFCCSPCVPPLNLLYHLLHISSSCVSPHPPHPFTLHASPHSALPLSTHGSSFPYCTDIQSHTPPAVSFTFNFFLFWRLICQLRQCLPFSYHGSLFLILSNPISIPCTTYTSMQTSTIYI